MRSKEKTVIYMEDNRLMLAREIENKTKGNYITCCCLICTKISFYGKRENFLSWKN